MLNILKNHELLLTGMPLLLILFSLFIIVLDSAIINLHAIGPVRIKPAPDISIMKKPIIPTPSELPTIKFSKPELKIEIEKKIEKFKENKVNSYPEQARNKLYGSDRENFQSIVNYVRGFAYFIINVPQMIYYR